MTTCFRRVESLGSLDRDLLKLTDLPDQLSLLSQLGCFLILTLLEGLLQVTMHLIPDRFVFQLFLDDLLCSSIFVSLDLCNDFFLLVD